MKAKQRSKCLNHSIQTYKNHPVFLLYNKIEPAKQTSVNFFGEIFCVWTLRSKHSRLVNKHNIFLFLNIFHSLFVGIMPSNKSISAWPIWHFRPWHTVKHFTQACMKRWMECTRTIFQNAEIRENASKAMFVKA